MNHLCTFPIGWLVADNAGLSDVGWLETVTNTGQLEIAGNPDIRDLSPVRGMSRLTVVVLSEDMRPLTDAIAGDVSFSFRYI